MGELIVVDFLFARLCRDISKWYDRYYYGKDKEIKKNNHLMVMESKYTADRFTGKGEEHEVQVVEFLTHIQREVDNYI